MWLSDDGGASHSSRRDMCGSIDLADFRRLTRVGLDDRRCRFDVDETSVGGFQLDGEDVAAKHSDYRLLAEGFFISTVCNWRS